VNDKPIKDAQRILNVIPANADAKTTTASVCFILCLIFQLLMIFDSLLIYFVSKLKKKT